MPRRRAPAAKRAPKVIDLFAGCGGMTHGFRSEGFEPVLAVEHNGAAAATYASNFGEDHVLHSPIEDLTVDDLVDADIVIGGPPCQGFSSLGKKQEADRRNGYWEHYVDVVAQVRPKVFVLENVDRFLRSTQFQLLQVQTQLDRLAGYELDAYLLNSADYGVAQKRTRAIVIGSRIGSIGPPTPTHGRVPSFDGVEPWRTVRDEIGDVAWEPDDTLPAATTEVLGLRIPGPFKTAQLHVRRTYQDKSIQRFESIPPGGNRTDIPEELLYPCWRRHRTGSMDVMGRLRWDEPSITIRTEFFKPEKGRYLHPQWERAKRGRQVNRALTHYEAALLQSFPEDFLWCGSKIEIARQIGNAVPPRLAAAIARQVRSALDAS